MTALQTFVSQGWEQHADDAAGLADRLPAAVALVQDEPGLLSLANLAHHVHGEHLGDWDRGLRYLSTLSELTWYDNYGESGNALRRYAASLKLAAGGADERAEFGPSDRIRIGALAASALALRDTDRALALFEQVLAEARAVSLAARDPMHRALAITGNNLAVTLEEKADRSPRERELMILAAETGREFWGRAGTWLETARAEYRLAMTWLAAGDADKAREHAQAGIGIVGDQVDPPATERFFAWEALAQAARAQGDEAARTQAVERARAAFESLPDDDKAWCRDSLERIAA